MQALTKYGIPAMLVAGVLAVLVTLFSASRQSSEKSGLERLAVGEMTNAVFMPDMVVPVGQFEDGDGTMVSLQDFRGNVIVLNIWNESCPPCEAEMPSLAALQLALAGEGISVVAVAADRETSREGNRSSLQQWTNGALDFYFDKSFGIAFDIKAQGLPTTVIYDRSGRERARVSGEADWASPEAVALIREIASL